MPADPKPGYKTTEFWLSTAAVVIGLVLSSGFLNPEDPGHAQVLRLLGLAASTLGALGYQVSRAHVKATGAKYDALASAMKVLPKDPP